MMLSKTIVTERLYLRSLEITDATEQYAAWLNDPLVNQYLETRAVSVNDLRQYIREKRESPEAIFLGIFWKEHASSAGKNGKHIGNVKLEPIDSEKATMGILIGDKNYWGKGIATDVTNMITDFAFSTLGLIEVNLGVLTQNAAAIRVYEKCGFVFDHAAEKPIDHEGVWYDQIYMKKLK